MIKPFSNNYEITQGFMQPNAALLGGFHKGIDYALPQGTPVLAIDSGKVRAVGVSNNEGRYIIIAHQWGESQYYHLERIDVEVGASVYEGVGIALSGSTGIVTGPHLHLQTYKNGILTNPQSIIDSENVISTQGYIMPPGGSLSYAAKSLNITLEALLNANPSYKENPDLVYTGAVLVVPSSKAESAYVVKSGDTLSEIAAWNGMSLEQLLQRNEQFRKNPDIIQPGDEVKF